MVFQNNLLMGAASTQGGGTVSGQLWVLGGTNVYRYGNDSGTSVSSPIQVGSDEDWISLTGMGADGVGGAMRSDGTIWFWGRDFYGASGSGAPRSDKSSPVQIGSDEDWFQLQQGTDVTYALNNDGELYFTGLNDLGQGGQGNTTNVSSLTQIGSLTDWKGDVTQTDINDGFNTFRPGSYSVHIIKEDGTLWGWGFNNVGQLGDGSTTNRSSPVQIGSDTDWKWLSCRTYHVLAERTDGTIWAWGSGGDGQLGNGDVNNISSPVQIGSITDYKHWGAGYVNSSFIKSDGTLWMCGKNNVGQLGIGSTGLAVSSPVQVGSDTDWHRVLPGGNNTNGAIRTDGTLWMWGYNNVGQLGTNDTTWRSSPTQIGSETDWGYNLSGNYANRIMKALG